MDNTYHRVVTNGFATSTPSSGQRGSAAAMGANVVEPGASRPWVCTGMANNMSILYPVCCLYNSFALDNSQIGSRQPVLTQLSQIET
jgi:hypothetical protein